MGRRLPARTGKFYLSVSACRNGSLLPSQGKFLPVSLDQFLPVNPGQVKPVRPGQFLHTILGQFVPANDIPDL